MSGQLLESLLHNGNQAMALPPFASDHLQSIETEAQFLNGLATTMPPAPCTAPWAIHEDATAPCTAPWAIHEDATLEPLTPPCTKRRTSAMEFFTPGPGMGKEFHTPGLGARFQPCTPGTRDYHEVEDPNEGRMHREFGSIKLVGTGQFSKVYRAVHVVDTLEYAIKVQMRPYRGDSQAPKREAFVLAKLAASPATAHIVRYVTSWWEDNALHIQMEMCSGSLLSHLDRRAEEAAGGEDPRLNESELAIVLRHVSSGLARIHSFSFAHMDVKPDNILTTQSAGGLIYKVADLGLVTCTRQRAGFCETTEGDRRYMAKELLNGSDVDLAKTDVYSLGLMAFEAATNPEKLPSCGDEWRAVRDGDLKDELLPPLSEQMHTLLFSLLSGQPAQRPTCAAIEAHPCLAFAEQSPLAPLRPEAAEAAPPSASSSAEDAPEPSAPSPGNESDVLQQTIAALTLARREAEEQRKLVEKYRAQLAALGQAEAA